MRIFQSGLYLSLDYGNGQARKLEVDKNSNFSVDELSPETFKFEKGDALLSEIKSFLTSVREIREPMVNAQDGLNAMRVAWQIKNTL